MIGYESFAGTFEDEISGTTYTETISPVRLVIQGMKYEVSKGMTWRAWVESIGSAYGFECMEPNVMRDGLVVSGADNYAIIDLTREYYLVEPVLTQ